MTCIYPLWERLISMINIIGNPKKDNKRTPKSNLYSNYVDEKIKRHNVVTVPRLQSFFLYIQFTTLFPLTITQRN